MKNRNEIISILNHAWDMLPRNNEITDELHEVIRQLEDEWKDDFLDDDDLI